MKTIERARWTAVLRREPGADFVYAVSTTGIYCRPGCGARRPLRRHVRFFDTAAAAVREGYRACKRCGPDRRIAELCRYILAHAAEPLSLRTLSHRAGLSASHLQRVFTRATGVSPRAFAKACRLRTFRDGLRKGSVLDALSDAGFQSTSRAHGALGMTPGAYRREGAGEEIRYAVAESPLGRLLVASTSRGLCAVSLGGSPADLGREFPRARILKGALRAEVAAILAHLGGTPRLDLPTDVRATAFQARVWEELRKIPYGRTSTYAEIAQAIGRPRAVRAVARAIASNRLALVVPCHRVVRSDGGLGGYRWGTSRKKRLLEREGAR
jgi:AraC family transcriptional regulator, regulatory protein of adaptative response / methylated-DNA-[protein]-cysteine methyltransferase